MSLKTRVAKYKLKMWRHWRANGNCGRCGKPAGINKQNGKPYSECFKHRLMTANRMRIEMRRRRRELNLSCERKD